MRRIICDTNIWYWLAEGRIPASKVVGKHLIVTYVTGLEFCSTMNAMRNYDMFRKAVTAMWQFSLGNIPYPPLEYIKYVSGHPSDKSDWVKINSLLGTVIRIQNPNPAYDMIALEAYNDHNFEENQHAQWFIDFVEDFRSQIECMAIYKKDMALPGVRQEHMEVTRRFITSLLGGLNINWDAIDLFVRTLDEWLRQLAIHPTLKMKVNDWNDLLNLVYVKPGFLYWTEDRRKTKVYIVNAGCEQYLYKMH